MEESESEKEPSKFQLFIAQAAALGRCHHWFCPGRFPGVLFCLSNRPQTAELRNVYTDLDAAQSEVTTMEADYAELEAQIADLEEAEFQSILLDITTDIYAVPGWPWPMKTPWAPKPPWQPPNPR